ALDPPMTLYDHLSSRAGTFIWPIAALGLLAVGLLLYGIAAVPFGAVIAAVVLGVQVVLIVAMCFWFRCPRCSKSLASLVGYFGPLRRSKRQVQCCPFCATSFNEPL